MISVSKLEYLIGGGRRAARSGSRKASLTRIIRDIIDKSTNFLRTGKSGAFLSTRHDGASLSVNLGRGARLADAVGRSAHDRVAEDRRSVVCTVAL